MSGSQGDNIEQSRSVNISGGTVNASGAGAFSLGDNYGTIANTINQLPNFDAEPDKKELKQLLTQLQTAVLETELDAEDQEDTVEQIKAIASVLENLKRMQARRSPTRKMLPITAKYKI